MPVSRSTRATVSTKVPRPPSKPMGLEIVKTEKDEGSQTKRSPSSPQGGPNKRSALGDITNATKNQAVLPNKSASSKGDTKKTVQKTIVVQEKAKKEAHVKKTVKKTSPGDSTSEKNGTRESSESKPLQKQQVEEKPEEVPEFDDIDKENQDDPFMSAEYAKDIFDYMKEREEKFILPAYMEKQHNINQEMRAILVDWMVEIQENFELNHETLYLAVKLVDHYLVEAVCMREMLQLIGSTTILIASKFEERCPPCVDDFLYICDDAYKREELLVMEMNILKMLKFDINIPTAYRFLRRYAKCARATMETLTLARYVCELTLQNYDYAQCRASKLAASCLLLALKMKNLGGWTSTLEYYSGYKLIDLKSLVKRLNFMLTYQLDEKLKAVQYKYSHKVFFEVAKTPLLDMLELEEALKS
ncbi:G2/mitotic-specific cyclin-B3 [Latimeria chalumnae]|uniref:Cyclin B3 n=1 Tax=Latimeria chalumnae TaxID=7897 RepID=H3B4L3_LATCH|nr:PREDICTED: G2/mitotic-specific cyclin-B3 isoform X1 [Latimeria chalumnae]XP_014342087.1 PREDICTED: G2/mitotic-specific cyclin-B3 isoform X1 [Latimeria chalumnae]XP_014342088.1 PREDICTED: G2/mitotic-specific cyclin-B3 isoform X1 [Latimeria chalumnae]|eukprot:XP_005992950.1 PREDICTED: G2/mitotic-specific cyclin-B3 isoform X1 [Latimeria chalumnae]